MQSYPPEPTTFATNTLIPSSRIAGISDLKETLVTRKAAEGHSLTYTTLPGQEREKGAFFTGLFQAIADTLYQAKDGAEVRLVSADAGQFHFQVRVQGGLFHNFFLSFLLLSFCPKVKVSSPPQARSPVRVQVQEGAFQA